MHSKDLSGQWGEGRNLLPPQGPLPDPRQGSPGQEIRLSDISLYTDTSNARAQAGLRSRMEIKGTLETSRLAHHSLTDL